MSVVSLEVAGKGNYYVEEAIKVLRTNIQFSGNDMKVIMFTSCGENEGKTTVALHGAKRCCLSTRTCVNPWWPHVTRGQA